MPPLVDAFPYIAAATCWTVLYLHSRPHVGAKVAAFALAYLLTVASLLTLSCAAKESNLRTVGARGGSEHTLHTDQLKSPPQALTHH